MRNIIWYLFIFKDKDKTELYKIMKFEKIKDLSYIVGLDHTIVSNYFHNLIKPRGALKYCYIYQTKLITSEKINN
tara:strand:- start:262 stop:486 length:225 start_codon:yes stop_codon:yes gene_type:complete